MDKNQAFIPIGKLAEILNVSQRTLRIYDAHRVLPSQRSNKDRRYYTLLDIEKGKLILFLTRNLSLNLSCVKIIFLFLKKMNVHPKDYISYMKKVADFVNIDYQIQQDNILKNSKKGRRKKVF